MEKLPLTTAHLKKLAEYGLQDIPRSACECLQFAPGETISREGAPISRLAVVIDGRAKICRTAANGKSLILCYYISDGLIGEIELLSNQEKATATVTAISDFECVVVSYRNCAVNLKTNVAFLNKMGTVLAEKLSKIADNLVSSALCSGEQRLCHYILQSSHHGVFSDILIDVSCSVGLSYRHMFRLLGQLCEEGILEKRENGYFISNRTELARRSCLMAD